MNKKALFLMALAILSTGVVVANSASVEAKVVDTHYNGAIVRQLKKDNTKEYNKIKEKYNEDETDVDFQIDVIEYYEKHSNFAEADRWYETLIKTVQQSDSYTKRVCVKKYKDLLLEKILINPNYPRYYYMLYEWEKNFGSNALYYLEQALALDRANVYYEYEYGKYFIGTKDNKKSISMLDSLKKANPREIAFRLSLAEAYKYEGMFDEAIKEYKVALSFDPTNSDIINAIENVYSTSEGKDIQSVSAKNKNTDANMYSAVDSKKLNKKIKNKNIKSKKKYSSVDKKKNI